jgi:ATP-dependent RNA helicase DDX27
MDKKINFDYNGFIDFSLSMPLIKACSYLGYYSPTPVQSACIPLVLAGRDISCSAATGSGKTASFMLPLLERIINRKTQVNNTVILVLSPTRELCLQVHSMTCKLAYFTDIRVDLVTGGLNLNPKKKITRFISEVVIATPGRIVDVVQSKQSMGFDGLSTLVLDEADKLLELEFIKDIEIVFRMCQLQRQTLLYSSTMTEKNKNLSLLDLKNPIRLAIGIIKSPSENLRQEILRLKGNLKVTEKIAMLCALCDSLPPRDRTIIFLRTKKSAHRMKILFSLTKLPLATELHGNMTQIQRYESLNQFQKGITPILFCTDLASRGLDIPLVQTVINFDAPQQFKCFVNRIGRTGRAGASGRAITFIEDKDRAILKKIKNQKSVKVTLYMLQPWQILKWRTKIEALRMNFIKALKQSIFETSNIYKLRAKND